jgi:hypothetical protein
MPRDLLWRLLDDVLLRRRRRRGRRLTRRDGRLGLGRRRLGRRWLRGRRFGRRRFGRNDRWLGRGWSWLRLGRRRRFRRCRHSLLLWQRRLENHLDPAFGDRFEVRKGLRGEEQRQQHQTGGVSGQR